MILPILLWHVQTVEAKIRAREESPDAEVEAAAAAREITVSFNADVNDNMPWKFQPTQRSIKVVERRLRTLVSTGQGHRQGLSIVQRVATGPQMHLGLVPKRTKQYLRVPQLRPGQSTLAFYTAENTSDRVITGVSTYNVTPQQAGLYFNKIQCFCFEVRCLHSRSCTLPFVNAGALAITMRCALAAL